MGCGNTIHLDVENFQVASLDCFSRFMLKTERFLTAWAAAPVLGSPAGAIKVALGVVQTAVSLVAMAIFSLFKCKSKTAGKAFEYSLMHFANGGGNILRGLTETIPFVGLVAWVKGKKNREDNSKFNDAQKDKRVQYHPFKNVEHEQYVYFSDTDDTEY